MSERDMTDVYHITVAGINPHHFAAAIQEEGNPFYKQIGNASVHQHIITNGQLVGGIVEVWSFEHLTSEQEQYLRDQPNVIDVRHIWPE